MNPLWLPGPRVRPVNPHRRAVLRGMGGIVLGLPFLESLAPPAQAGSKGQPRYTVFMRQANGVTQADGDEPEGFWPRSVGRLTTAGLAAEPDRVLSALAAWAPRLLPVRGLTYAFESNGCGHSGGGNQCLTAAQVSADPSGASSLAMGESIDNRIARAFPDKNGGEPLTLYTGPRGGYLEEVLSYRGPLDLRAAEDDPWSAYRRMVGIPDGASDPHAEARRASVNDLVRDQLQALRGSPRLSTSDRQRLDAHLDAVRDFEQLSCLLSDDEAQAMASAAGQGTLNDNRLQFARWHIDLLSLAFACDYARVATLQVGDGNDSTEFTVDGQRLPSFHYISHRIYSDGAEGDVLKGAWDMHHAIDLLFAGLFDHLLTRLDEHGLLEQSVAVWCNDLANGPSHGYTNVPYILAGEAGGALKTGQYVDVGGITNNQLFNTLLTAVGIDSEDGEPILDFGDPSLAPGVLDALLA